MPLLLFIFAIPALVALGHDLYLYYMHQQMGFEFASLGFIWTHYQPDSYKWVVENLQDYWPYINAFLEQKAFFVGIGFALFCYVIIFILNMMGFFGEKDIKAFTGNRKVDEALGAAKKGKFKYKRK